MWLVAPILDNAGLVHCSVVLHGLHPPCFTCTLPLVMIIPGCLQFSHQKGDVVGILKRLIGPIYADFD